MTTRLKLLFVPFQLRHAGPSDDRAQGLRSLESIRKGGRWRQFKSVMRYEQASRTAAELQELCMPRQRHIMSCVEQLKGILLRGQPVPNLPYALLL